jgi:NADH dehydrogenase (ubiquinone) Fe-S protein 3
MLKEINSNQIGFANHLIRLMPQIIEGIRVYRGDLIVKVDRNNLLKLLIVLRDHTNFQYKSLIDLTCVDYFSNANRFFLIYNFLSYKRCSRIRVETCTSEILPVKSVTNLYKSAGWLEREVWDLFGVFFEGNFDLRRILTDYGFDGFPLRKDFPLTGYLELRYDDEKKAIVYESIETAQEYRFFNFLSPWEQTINFNKYRKVN